jgi:excisionase family DNA binding protein
MSQIATTLLFSPAIGKAPIALADDMLVTTGEAAQLLQTTGSTVRRWAKNGRLRSFAAAPGSSRLVIAVRDLRVFVTTEGMFVPSALRTTQET